MGIGSFVSRFINKDHTPVGVLVPEWLSCAEAVSFVAATTSALFISELREVLKCQEKFVVTFTNTK